MDTINKLQTNNPDKLLDESGLPCISILMPMHRLSPDRRVDNESLNKVVKQAKEMLKNKYTPDDFDLETILKHIDEVSETVDYVHSKDVIGIFVSQHTAQAIQFPFTVTKKIKVGTAFDTRDILYFKEHFINYLVLTISKKYIHLYKGNGEVLQEIADGNFPITYTETYEYARSSQSNSFANNTQKNFERDKTVMQEIRLVEFLRTADSALEKYIDHLPLIVSGGKKELADYLSVTLYKKNIIEKINGNYGFNGHMQLAGLSWKKVQDFLIQKEKESIQGLYELIGKKRVAIGLEEVWNSAKKGNGLELFVEKDLEFHAFLINESNNLKLTKPKAGDYIFVNDSVEQIIRMVREKGGKITFTRNEAMSDFAGIALKLRYVNE